MSENGDTPSEDTPPRDPLALMRHTLARVDERSQQAMHETMQATGALMAELSRLIKRVDALSERLVNVEDKLDAHMGDVRIYLQETRQLRLEVRDSIRPRVESIADTEEVVTAVTKRLAGVEGFVTQEQQARRVRRKAAWKLAKAAGLGAAGAIGAHYGLAALLDLLQHLH